MERQWRTSSTSNAPDVAAQRSKSPSRTLRANGCWGIWMKTPYARPPTSSTPCPETLVIASRIVENVSERHEAWHEM
eukprot:CAMPEP_0182844180 /NCGR_PEP_ID=MMETSP0006_2-20121128/26613_1 /TAXON_ID=97485 /ORGANISM="Prymnesium parvum, Strain Texoma1" /LENGTH=76 /DNA_ID=CAMNT_0024974081 /DNA_START=62 /DNA_END=292 /DNA_ORIENTATION=-